MTWCTQLEALTTGVFVGYAGRRALARHLGVLETTLTKWLSDGGTPSEGQQERINEVYRNARSSVIELDSGA